MFVFWIDSEMVKKKKSVAESKELKIFFKKLLSQKRVR